MNWHWPATKTNTLRPWYVILRRSIFWPLLMLGIGIMAVAAVERQMFLSQKHTLETVLRWIEEERKDPA